MTSSQHKPPSDREKAALHGPVRSVIEERTYPAWTDAEGEVTPAAQQWNKIEYDRDGRIFATTWRAPARDRRTDSLTVIRFTRNATGDLLKRTAETDGKVAAETLYEYDDRGRLKSVSNSLDPSNPIAFRYDPSGRKTKIAIKKPVESPQGTTAVSSSMENLFDEEGSSFTNTSEGGSTMTLYDELDRPAEVQFHDVNGALTSRAIRVYDSQGRISEEKMLMADPIAMIPASDRKAIFDAGNIQDLRDQMSAFLGGSEMWSVKYEYDDKGRKVLTIQNTFNHIHMTTDTKYNQQGDVASEVTHYEASGTGNPAAEENRSSEIIYTYEYDAQGNWITQRTTSRDLPSGILKDVGAVVKRTIDYY
ncbi:MAG TPA: hypothetical protein VL135_14360 [Terracidiphilus sp.]|jgi:YD repeat-containing protein|nr:hypothetical protein [Terracidiphilus sp.]